MCKVDKSCDEYPKWKAKKDAKNEAIFKAKQEVKAMDEIVYRNYPKVLKKYRQKIKRGR
jgi:predicted  nucleic acid-binding Zn-ribbon protein